MPIVVRIIIFLGPAARFVWLGFLFCHHDMAVRQFWCLVRWEKASRSLAVYGKGASKKPQIHLVFICFSHKPICYSHLFITFVLS